MSEQTTEIQRWRQLGFTDAQIDRALRAQLEFVLQMRAQGLPYQGVSATTGQDEQSLREQLERYLDEHGEGQD